MSMTKYAGVGPVEFRYQAHELTIEAQAERIAALAVEDGKLYAPSNDELIRMIENIADQLSSVASQLVDVRQRLDKLEARNSDSYPQGTVLVSSLIEPWQKAFDRLSTEGFLQSE